MAGTYKTANGQTLDMRALALKNENVRAVGNMKVNARGDMLDDGNNIIVNRPKQVATQYAQEVQIRTGREGCKQPTHHTNSDVNKFNHCMTQSLCQTWCLMNVSQQVVLFC